MAEGPGRRARPAGLEALSQAGSHPSSVIGRGAPGWLVVERHETLDASEQVRALRTGPPLTDLDPGMRTLLRLLHHLDDAPLLPIEHSADLFDYLTPVLVDHPLYREVRDLLDAETDQVTGRTARGERAQVPGPRPDQEWPHSPSPPGDPKKPGPAGCAATRSRAA
ncbi:hypothetical protein [Streptomyces sp. NBC_01235]|uniref:hypothetical protein n=1 Tax=Streptomyces sp. NBC_01235 TaxID=2903788 RepID=UPI002E141BBF|nr:hypothetical protein OG289_04940 [Streptomyces sp. NBC_01235]